MLPLEFVGEADRDRITCGVRLGGRRVGERNRHLLHHPNGLTHFRAVSRVEVVCHALHRMLKVGSVVLAGIVKNHILWDVLVPALEFTIVLLGRGSSCSCVVPPVARAAATSSPSVVIVSCPVPGRRARSINLFFDVVAHVELLGYVIDSDGQYYDDGRQGEPRVLCLNTRRDDDDGDGRVSRYRDEHRANRLRFYFKFHQ